MAYTTLSRLPLKKPVADKPADPAAKLVKPRDYMQKLLGTRTSAISGLLATNTPTV